MEPLKNEPAIGRFDSLKKVTPLSKYLAMILFIAMPFIGGWIGYRYAPEKEVLIEVSQNDVAQNTRNIETTQTLCGKKFAFVGTSFIDGVNVEERVAQLLSSEASDNDESQDTACHLVIANSQDVSTLTVTTEKVRYDYTAITATSSFEAYLVKFETEGTDTLGEGNLIDKNTLEVFRINEMDGSKGKSLGKLTE